MIPYRFEKERVALLNRLMPVVKRGQLREEKRLIAELFDRYPDLTFWEKYKPAFPFESFADFFSPIGRERIQIDYAHWRFKPPAHRIPVKLSDNKFGEDRKITRRPTLIDFLNG